MTTIGGIKNFTQAIGTGGNIGQHERGLVAAGLAGTDFKLLITDGIKPRSFEALDKTARRFIGFEPEKKLFECGARTFDFDKDALRRIVNPAGHSEFRGEAEDERTEADALHRAANGEFQARALAGWSGLVHAGILSEPAPN